MTFASVWAAMKRYSGYTRFLSPVWAAYVSFIQAYPQLAGALLLAAMVYAIF